MWVRGLQMRNGCAAAEAERSRSNRWRPPRPPPPLLPPRCPQGPTRSLLSLHHRSAMCFMTHGRAWASSGGGHPGVYFKCRALTQAVFLLLWPCVTRAAPGYGLVPGFDDPSSLPAAAPALAASCFRGPQPPGSWGDSVTAGTPSAWAYQRLTLVDPAFQEGCHGKLLSVASAARPPAPAPAYLGWL